ncbi:MAG: sigma-70 family RNA polymerase sigma factor [Bacteroidales bacterium]|nr:sigma-70 family RNA polymerase sigma factor [Bacteroidales bacterium]
MSIARHTYSDKEQRFMDILAQYDCVVRRVCFMYAGPDYLFDDLYQETMANLWRGMDGFRGDSAISTWIYRTTVNTCISWIRRNRRHARHADIDEALHLVTGDDSEHAEFLKQMYRMIANLDDLEKAIVMMRLDEKSYEEIASVTGLTKGNVATRLFRAKEKLKEMSKNIPI